MEGGISDIIVDPLGRGGGDVSQHLYHENQRIVDVCIEDGSLEYSKHLKQDVLRELQRLPV